MMVDCSSESPAPLRRPRPSDWWAGAPRAPHRSLRRIRSLTAVAGLAILLAACGSAAPPAGTSSAPVTPAATVVDLTLDGGTPAAMPGMPMTPPAGSLTPALPTASIPADSPQVGIANFTFGPATLTIAAGTTVTWTNHDDTPHTVTSADQRFPSSGALDTNDHYSYRFTVPGTYPYYCSIHPQMTGQIIVH